MAHKKCSLLLSRTDGLLVLVLTCSLFLCSQVVAAGLGSQLADSHFAGASSSQTNRKLQQAGSGDTELGTSSQQSTEDANTQPPQALYQQYQPVQSQSQQDGLWLDLQAVAAGLQAPGDDSQSTAQLPEPVLKWTRLGADAVLEEATHECFGQTYEQRVCKYYNLILWNETFYYVTPEPDGVGLPDVALSWVSHEPFVSHILGDGVRMEVLHPDDLPFDWEVMPKLEIQQALIWLLTYHDNYGHLLGEHAPVIHAVLCTYLGRCSYTEDDLEGLHLLVENWDDDTPLEDMPSAANEMLECFTKNAPVRMNDVIFRDYALVVREAVAGIGPYCRGFPWCRPAFGRNQLPPATVMSFKRRMMACTGFPQDLYAPIDPPNILVVNRPYEAGRSILNLDDLMAMIRAKLPKADVQLTHLEDESIIDQARMYHNVSILVQVHGAALGNMIFLPRGAVLIDIAPQNNEDKHAWAYFMAADYAQLGYAPFALPTQKSVLMLAKVRETKEWHMLPSDMRARILEDGKCPENWEVNYMFDAYAVCNFAWFLKNSNMVVDLQQMGELLDTTVLHLARNREKVLGMDTAGNRFDLVRP